MKKIISIVLAVFMILTFCSCGKSKAKKAELYDAAVRLFNDRQYQEAWDLFSEIEDYLDSSSYAEKCHSQVVAKRNFEGSWCWANDSSIMNSNNDIYMHVYNPFDKYIIDFDKQTITLEFNSSTKSFTIVKEFTVLDSYTLVCDEFRDTSGAKLYWNYSLDNGGIKITRSDRDLGHMNMFKLTAENQ